MYHQCDDAEDFHKRRSSTRALLTDHGTEAEMYEMPIDLLQRFAKKYGAKEPGNYYLCFRVWGMGDLNAVSI